MNKRKSFLVVIAAVLCVTLCVGAYAQITQWEAINLDNSLYFEDSNEKAASNASGVFVFVKRNNGNYIKQYQESTKSWVELPENPNLLEANLICGDNSTNFYYLKDGAIGYDYYMDDLGTWLYQSYATLPDTIKDYTFDDMCFYNDSIYLCKGNQFWKCTATSVVKLEDAPYANKYTFIPIHTKSNVEGSLDAGLYIGSSSGSVFKLNNSNRWANFIDVTEVQYESGNPFASVSILDRGFGTDGSFIYLVGGTYIRTGVDEFGQSLYQKYDCNYVDMIYRNSDGLVEMSLGYDTTYLVNERVAPKVLTTRDNQLMVLGGIVTPGAWEGEISK